MITGYYWVQDPDGGEPQPARVETDGDKQTIWIIGIDEDVGPKGWTVLGPIAKA